MVRSVLCPRLVDLGSHALVDLSKTISIDLNGSPLVLATAKQSIPLKHGSTMRVGRVVAVIESSLISASIKDVASTKDQPNLDRDIVKLSLLPGTNAATRKALKARFSNLTGSKKLQSLLKSRCGEYQHADASDRIVLLEEVYQQFISAGADMWRCTGLGKYERLQKIEALDLLRRKCLYLKIPKLVCEIAWCLASSKRCKQPFNTQHCCLRMNDIWKNQRNVVPSNDQTRKVW